MNRIALALVLSFAACTERALEVPEDAGRGRDLSPLSDLGGDLAFDMRRPPPDPCPAGTEFIYTIDEDTTLSRFSPPLLQFFDVGKVACPTALGGTPNSMAIDREGNGWVNYSSGELFRLITSTGVCTATSYAPGQSGLVAFGMSFAQDAPGSTSETLYVADTQTSASTSLATIDLATFKIASKLPIVGGLEPELTGDDQANLWGFFPSDMPPVLARIDKRLGTLDRVTTLPTLDGTPRAWGVAAFQGNFYIFLQRDSDASTRVWQVDGSTHALTNVLNNTGRRIVGVGVATCAGNGLDP